MQTPGKQSKAPIVLLQISLAKQEWVAPERHSLISTHSTVPSGEVKNSNPGIQAHWNEWILFPITEVQVDAWGQSCAPSAHGSTVTQPPEHLLVYLD